MLTKFGSNSPHICWLDNCQEGKHWVFYVIPRVILGFKINIAERPKPRREFLSPLSLVFEPLGVASPFLLKGRKIMQELCKFGNFQCEDQIPDDTKCQQVVDENSKIRCTHVIAKSCVTS